MEIFQNTILKFVVRQGTDTERKTVILTSGELGYATDTRRLYVGNGVLSGGDIVGNICIGTDTTLTSLASLASGKGTIGDYGFVSDTNKLYRIKYNDGGITTDWELVGGVYSSGDSYIVVNSNNQLSLNPLSSGMISNDLVKGPLMLDSGKLSLSSTIPFQTVSTKTITVSSGLKSTVNGVNVTNTGINSLSANILIESNQILARYDGTIQNLNYSRNLSSTPVTYLSAGHYRFNYGPLTTSNLYPTTQILGESPIGCYSRILSITDRSCDVKILSSDGTSTVNAAILLTISY